MDNASYFASNPAQKFDEETSIKLCYLLRGSAPGNPVEECWKKLDQALGNRLFNTLSDPRDAVLAALDSIKPAIYSRTCGCKSQVSEGVPHPERRAAEGRVRLPRRAGELPRVGRDQLVRLPLPRRTYFRDHLEHVAETFAAVAERRDGLPGYEIVDEPEMAELRHFSAELRPVE